MFKFFRKQKQPDYIAQVTEYINSVYIEHEEYADNGIKYSVRVWDESEEDYDFDAHKKLGPMQPGDVPVTYADTSALERDFGFKPNTSLREGLRRFAQWYKEFYL